MLTKNALLLTHTFALQQLHNLLKLAQAFSMGMLLHTYHTTDYPCYKNCATLIAKFSSHFQTQSWCIFTPDASLQRSLCPISELIRCAYRGNVTWHCAQTRSESRTRTSAAQKESIARRIRALLHKPCRLVLLGCPRANTPLRITVQSCEITVQQRLYSTRLTSASYRFHRLPICAYQQRLGMITFLSSLCRNVHLAHPFNYRIFVELLKQLQRFRKMRKF